MGPPYAKKPSAQSDGLHINPNLNPSNVEKVYLTVQQEIAKNPLDFERAVYAVLTALTSGKGLGYHRATCFLTNDKRMALEGIMGKGPVTCFDLNHVWNQGEYLTLEQELAACSRVLPDDSLTRLVKGMSINLSQYKAAKPEDHNVHYIDSGYFSKLFMNSGLHTNGTMGIIQLVPKELKGIVTVENFSPYRPEVGHEELRVVASFTNLIEMAYHMNKYIRDGLAHYVKNASTGIGGFAGRSLKLTNLLGALVDSLPEGWQKDALTSQLLDFSMYQQIIYRLCSGLEAEMNKLPGSDNNPAQLPLPLKQKGLKMKTTKALTYDECVEQKLPHTPRFGFMLQKP